MENYENLTPYSDNIIEIITGKDNMSQSKINSTKDAALYCLAYDADEYDAVVMLTIAPSKEKLLEEFGGSEYTKKFVDASGYCFWQEKKDNALTTNVQVENTMLFVVSKTEDKTMEILRALGYQ